jgi:hypothetical protein
MDRKMLETRDFFIPSFYADKIVNYGFHEWLSEDTIKFDRNVWKSEGYNFGARGE